MIQKYLKLLKADRLFALICNDIRAIGPHDRPEKQRIAN